MRRDTGGRGRNVVDLAVGGRVEFATFTVSLEDKKT